MYLLNYFSHALGFPLAESSPLFLNPLFNADLDDITGGQTAHPSPGVHSAPRVGTWEDMSPNAPRYVLNIRDLAYYDQAYRRYLEKRAPGTQNMAFRRKRFEKEVRRVLVGWVSQQTDAMEEWDEYPELPGEWSDLGMQPGGPVAWDAGEGGLGRGGMLPVRWKGVYG